MVRLGIAGIGAIAESYIGLIAAGQVENVKITALSSRNETNMKEVKEKYNLHDAKLYTDYEKMLASGDIEAVIICTPHYYHVEMGILATQYNIHILVEKPLGVYSKEALSLIEVANEKPYLKCGVLYNRRASIAYQKVKELILQNAIGKLKRVNWIITNLYRTDAYYRSSPWRGTYDKEGGGVLINQAAHQLDLLTWLCPMPTKIHAFCLYGEEREIEVENDMTVFMNFEGGATGQFIASAREYPGTNRLELIGDLGQIIIEDDCHITYRNLKVSETQFNKENTKSFAWIPYIEEVYDFENEDNSVQHAATLQNFIDAILKDSEILCSLSEGIKSLMLLNGIYLSGWLEQAIEFPFELDLFNKALEEHFKS